MTRALVSLMLAVVLGATACADPSSSEAASSGGTYGSAGGSDGASLDGVDDPPGGLAFDPDTDAEAHTVRLALAAVSTRQPSEISLASQESVIVADLLYDGLTEVASAGGPLRAALSREWSANEDFTRWRFEIDPTRGVTAEQVAAQFAALLVPGARPGVASSLADVTGVVATGDGAVEFELGRPAAALPWLLSSTALGVVGVDGAPTGRFTVEQDDAEMLVLVADPSGPGASVDRVEISWASDPEAAYRLLTLGQVDGAVADPQSMEDARTRFGAIGQARAITRFFGMSSTSASLADGRLQQAVLLAVDRQHIAEDVSLAPLLAVDGVVAPGLAGYQPGTCGSDCRFDRKAASALVGEVTAETGRPTVLSIAYGGESQRLVARALADDLEAVGFQTQLLQQTTEQLAGTIDGSGADLFAYGWVAPAGSIDAVVPALLRSDAPANGLAVRSDDVDRLVDEAAANGNDQSRWDLLEQAHRTAMATHRIVPLAAATSYLVQSPEGAVVPVRADGSIDFGVGR